MNNSADAWPLISVAVCTYNGEKYVREQLLSIINQTRRPDEIVICDDCSKDRTIEIVRDTLSSCQIAHSVLVNDTNIGFVKNFEKCSQRCKGDIIFWADQDDIWLPKKIEKMILPFENDPKCLYVFSDAIVVDSDLRVINHSFLNKWHFSSHLFDKEITFGRYPYGCMLALRSSLLKEIIPFSVAHDFAAARGAQKHKGSVVEISEALMYYRRHEKAVTYSINNEKKKKSIIKRGVALFMPIINTDKAQWFDNPEWQLVKMQDLKMQDVNNDNRAVDYNAQLDFLNVLNDVVNKDRFNGIALLILAYCRGLYSFRGSFKQMIYDIIYLLLHFESQIV